MININEPIFTYKEFLSWMEEKVKNYQPKTLATGEIDLDHYNVLNLKRMKRIEKTYEVNPSLAILIEKIHKNQTWWVITEPWCGDSAQSLPALAKIAAINSKIDFKIMLRDINTDWMNNYLTDGGKAIPILTAFDENENELFVWGPRPAPAQKITNDWKTKKDKSWEEYEKELHTWYAKDKFHHLEEEFLHILKNIT